AEIMDYMSISSDAKAAHSRQLVRHVEMVRGTMPLRMECCPAFNYGRDRHHTSVLEEGAVFHSPRLSLGLASPVPLTQNSGGVSAELKLQEGQRFSFVLRQVTPGCASCGLTLSEEEGKADFVQTVQYWRRWISKCSYAGRWREMVHRSALVLKL